MNKVDGRTEKECSKCQKVKPVSDYHIIKKGTEYRTECKQCNNAMCRAYKAANRKKIADYNKEYKATNADDISVYNHNYNIENREAIQKRQNKTRAARLSTDENFRLTCYYRKRLYTFIKSQGKHCSTVIEHLLNCDWSAFSLWLTNQFGNKMSLDDYGEKWTIDHVVPCCNFDLANETQLLRCFHWSNLRPVIKLDNQKKTGKTLQIIIDLHQKNIIDFVDSQHEDGRHQYKLL